MAGNPIKIGSATLAALIPGIPSRIITDEFGVQHGVIPYQLGDQTISQNLRLTPGTLYNGTLTQFNGFFVERSGDITGREASAAIVEIGYAQIDPKFIVLPRRSHELQIASIIPSSQSLSGIFDTLTIQPVPIPHPVLVYKFSRTTVPGQLGTYGTPTNAPSISNYVYQVNTFNINPNITVQQKTITVSATLDTFNADGSCTRIPFSFTAVFTGVFSNNTLSLINPINFVFVPNPAGWLCIKEESTPICGGQLYLIEQQWKLNLVFSGSQAGTWWSNAIPVHCT